MLAPYFSVGSLEAGKAGTRQSLDGFLVVAVRTNQVIRRCTIEPACGVLCCWGGSRLNASRTWQSCRAASPSWSPW